MKKFFFHESMSLPNLIFIFDIIKKKIVSVGENVTKLKFNFLKFLTMKKFSINQHFFSIKRISLDEFE